MDFDIRSVLPTITVPTLVLQRANYVMVPAKHGRYLADHIEGAKYLEVPGGDAWFFTEGAEEVLDEVGEFLTGARPASSKRLLATLLFCDIVGSTERAAEMGDRSWRSLLESHREVCRGVLRQFGGREVDTAGDGFFATFAGPGRAIVCARALRETVDSLGLRLRIGLHTGEVDVTGEGVVGIAVHIAARVAAAAHPGEIVVSRTVSDLVTGSGVRFRDRGIHSLKGVPGRWELRTLAA
jgi:class 3 adenylate cyclase